MKNPLAKALLLAAAAIIVPTSASAEETGSNLVEFIPILELEILPVEITTEATGDTLVDDADLFAGVAAVSNEELDGQRGGQTIQLTNQTMVAITSGNVLNGDYIAGAVSLSDNALSNFNGIGNLLINTGAQASLQTGMNFTINVGE
ncbi:hypothetical protein [Allosphingosinicella vermicomposti]|uniref:hypothetical protein n=1 Tax=Allosphingosinicella vermicomposti TaxID=614671 RepID=UPI000D1044D5|nr:hypothetical protein [Allosphingosinicella vermicomposti]